MAGSTKVHFTPLHFPNQSSRPSPGPFPVWPHWYPLSLSSTQPSQAPSRKALCITTSTSSPLSKAKPCLQHSTNKMCTASPLAILTEERGCLEVLSTPLLFQGTHHHHHPQAPISAPIARQGRFCQKRQNLGPECRPS